MPAVADVLRPYWLQGLAEVSGQTSTSLKAWITEESFVFQQFDPMASCWTFFTGTPDMMVRSIAHDVSRMSASSFESIHAIPAANEIPRSSAWTLIRAYYAAFFAAHAIGRIFGQCVTQLEQSQSSALNKAIRSSDGTNLLTKGLHLCVPDARNSTFSIIKLSDGSHEDTWSQLGILLDQLGQKILTGASYTDSQSRQAVAVLFVEILDVMRTAPCHSKANWLSHVRNEINYKHQYGAWFPHQGAKQFRTKVADNIGLWRKSPQFQKAKSEHALCHFSAVCGALVSIAREIVLDMAERNSNRDSFLKYSALRVLAQRT